MTDWLLVGMTIWFSTLLAYHLIFAYPRMISQLRALERQNMELQYKLEAVQHNIKVVEEFERNLGLERAGYGNKTKQ